MPNLKRRTPGHHHSESGDEWLVALPLALLPAPVVGLALRVLLGYVGGL